MIWTVRADAPMFPSVRIHRLENNAQSNDTPEVIYSHSEATNLIVVCGRVEQPDDLLRARSIFETQDSSAIKIGFLTYSIPQSFSNQVLTLGATCDAVFFVPIEAREDVVQRLVRTITIPGSPNHSWCFDWNDMRSLVTNGDRSRPVRYGIGRAKGGLDAATQAAAAALDSIGAHNEPIGDSQVLFLVSFGKGGRGTDHKAASWTIRNQLGNNASYGSGMHFSEGLADDETEVDLFVFGRPSNWCPETPIEPQVLPDTVNGTLPWTLDQIPMFLRNPAK